MKFLFLEAKMFQRHVKSRSSRRLQLEFLEEREYLSGLVALERGTGASVPRGGPTWTVVDTTAAVTTASATSASPITIGNQVAGSFIDATGNPAQSHLVFAVNSNVWWLFTLTSNADGPGYTNH